MDVELREINHLKLPENIKSGNFFNLKGEMHFIPNKTTKVPARFKAHWVRRMDMDGCIHIRITDTKINKCCYLTPYGVEVSVPVESPHHDNAAKDFSELDTFGPIKTNTGMVLNPVVSEKKKRGRPKRKD